jgi:hypothetical protein
MVATQVVKSYAAICVPLHGEALVQLLKGGAAPNVLVLFGEKLLPEKSQPELQGGVAGAATCQKAGLPCNAAARLLACKAINPRLPATCVFEIDNACILAKPNIPTAVTNREINTSIKLTPRCLCVGKEFRNMCLTLVLMLLPVLRFE